MHHALQRHAISNGRFELVCSPATGRIVRYGPVGGPNVLWENPQAPATPSPFAGWINWGGDKVWIWPEDHWPQWQAGLVAPPGDPPAAPFALETDKLSMRLTSPVVDAYGVRITREISLAPEGPRVTLLNRLEKVVAVEPPGGKPLPLSVWTVTQIPAADHILARLLPHAPPPRYEPFPKSPWEGVRVLNDVALLTRPSAPWVKIGLEADVLAIPASGQLFVIRAPADKNETGGHEPCRRRRGPSAGMVYPPRAAQAQPRTLPVPAGGCSFGVGVCRLLGELRHGRCRLP
jgi:hypothetical protein